MTLLTLLCTATPATWAAAADILPLHRAEVWRELHGLGLVDNDGPTDLGRRLAAVSAGTLRAWQALPEPPQPRKARQKALQADGAPAASAARPRAAPAAGAMPRVRDYDTWTAARRAAFAAAGLDCRTPLGEFMAATVSAAVPGKWADCKIFGGTKRGPRCVRVPRAEFWPRGVYPEGLGVVDAPVETEGRAWGDKRLGYSPTNAGYDDWQQAWADREGYVRRVNEDGEAIGPWLKAGRHAEAIEQPEPLAAD